MVDFYSRSCQEAMKWGLSLLIHTWIPGYMYCCYVNQVSLHSDLYWSSYGCLCDFSNFFYQFLVGPSYTILLITL